MARITESAKWFVFAVKADDARRATYWRWLARLRRRELDARRAAGDSVGPSAVDIPPSVGHWSSTGGALDVDAVVEEVRRIRATVFRTQRGDEKPYLIDYPITEVDAASPLLGFALSDEVVSAATRYLGMVPILTMITVMASPYVPGDGFSGSQLFHSDWEDRRQVKVFVHCTDVAQEHGPLTAVAADASRRVKDAVDYHYGGPHFRLPDDQVLPRVDDADVTAFVGPTGSVTFIDTSSCLHLGSRVQMGATERLVVQFQFLTPPAFDLQLARPGRGRPFARVDGAFSAVQRLVLGATG